MDGLHGVDDIMGYNRRAWDRQVERGNRWTMPVGPEEIARARRGDWRIVLTPTKPVPADWFPPLSGLDVLCLASGGGQQGPILAAAGANVTVLDNSPEQLARDRIVAEREGLAIEAVLGDMADMSVFPDARFGLSVHPVSNVFVPDVRPVWREAFRVLRPGGTLLAGFMNPVYYLFDFFALEAGGFANYAYIGKNLYLDMGAGNDEAEIWGFVEDHLMAQMGEGDDVLRLGWTWAYRLIADGGFGGNDSLSMGYSTKAQYIDLFGWETIINT